MKKLLLSGVSVALLSLGGLSLATAQQADPAQSPTMQSPTPGAPTGDSSAGDPMTTPSTGTAADAAPAVESEPAPTGDLKAEAVQPAETVKVDEVLDADVIDATGEDVASVDSVLMTPDGGITHVVVSYGGFLGIGTKDVLVPWQDVAFNREDGTLRIPGNEADLDAAPEYVTQAELQEQQTQPADSGASLGTAPQQAQTPSAD